MILLKYNTKELSTETADETTKYMVLAVCILSFKSPQTYHHGITLRLAISLNYTYFHLLFDSIELLLLAPYRGISEKSIGRQSDPDCQDTTDFFNVAHLDH